MTKFNIGDKLYYKGCGCGDHTFAVVIGFEDEDMIHVRFDNGNRLICEAHYFELESSYMKRITQ